MHTYEVSRLTCSPIRNRVCHIFDFLLADRADRRFCFDHRIRHEISRSLFLVLQLPCPLWVFQLEQIFLLNISQFAVLILLSSVAAFAVSSAAASFGLTILLIIIVVVISSLSVVILPLFIVILIFLGNICRDYRLCMMVIILAIVSCADSVLLRIIHSLPVPSVSVPLLAHWPNISSDNNMAIRPIALFRYASSLILSFKSLIRFGFLGRAFFTIIGSFVKNVLFISSLEVNDLLIKEYIILQPIDLKRFVRRRIQ